MDSGVKSLGNFRARWQTVVKAALRGDLNGFGQLIPVFALIATYCLLDRLVMRITRLPTDSYFESSLIGSLLEHLPETGWRTLVAAAPLLITAPYWLRSTLYSWSRLENGRWLRAIVIFAAFLLAWSVGSDPFNLYFNRAFLADRAIAFALCGLIAWRPQFALPFVLVTIPLLRQSTVPLGGSALTMPLLPVRILILFSASLFLTGIAHSWRTRAFSFSLVCLVLAHYWPSGLGKLTPQWLWEDQVGVLLPATYANGWLGFLDTSTIESVTSWLVTFNVPLKLFTVAVECGALLAFTHRSALGIFLMGGMALHLGILLVTGINFWMWIAVDGCLLFVLLRSGKLFEFDRWHRGLSVVLILTATFWVRPGALIWQDVPATYTYEFKATAENGERYSLFPRWFAPYDNPFTLGGFGYLCTEQTLDLVWGVTGDATTARELRLTTEPSDVLQVEARLGKNRFDPVKAEQLEDFLRTSIGNYNSRLSKRTPLSWLASPPALITFQPTDALPPGVPIRHVTVHQVFSCYCGGRYVELRRQPVLDLRIDE